MSELAAGSLGEALVLAQESWAQVWPEAGQLSAAHFAEVNLGIPGRKFDPDTEMLTMLDLDGSLKIYTARRGGRLVGYLLWTIQFDPECKGLRFAAMGPWYVEPGQGGAGGKLFDYSMAALQELGLDYLLPHHRLQGRGADLSRFFQSRGGIETQRDFQIWLKKEKS